MSKACIVCKKLYMVEDKFFHKDKNRKDGLKSICKECVKAERRYFYELDILKKPTYKKTCMNKNCNNVFTTTNKVKIYCCLQCARSKRKDREYKDKANFIKRFSMSREIALNNNKKWSKKDINYLMRKRKLNVPYKKIALKLNRKVKSCIEKYTRMVIEIEKEIELKLSSLQKYSRGNK